MHDVSTPLYNPREIGLKHSHRDLEELLKTYWSVLWPVHLELLSDVSVSLRKRVILKEILFAEMIGYIAFWLLTRGKPY
jgi:hypothetical protein